MKRNLILLLLVVMAMPFAFSAGAVSPISVKDIHDKTVKLMPFESGTYKVEAIKTGKEVVPATGTLYYCQFEESSMMGLDIKVGNKSIKKQFGLYEDWKVNEDKNGFECDGDEDGIGFAASVLPYEQGKQIFMYFDKDSSLIVIYSIKDFKKATQDENLKNLEKILSL